QVLAEQSSAVDAIEESRAENEHELVRQARASVPSLRVLDDIARRIARIDDRRTSDPALLRDLNPQVRYVGARKLTARAPKPTVDLRGELARDDWVPTQRALLDAVVALARRHRTSST